MAAKKKNGAKKQELMITIRMGKRTKKQLLSHCDKRSKAEGRTVSMNQAVIDLINAAPT